MDAFFISESYLKEMSVINENVDFKMLKPTIIMVQDIYIQQILGTPLYNDLKTKIIADNTLATYPNEKALIDNYIAKALIWYVKMESTLEFKFRYMNKGILVNSSENGQPADTQDLKMLQDECKVKAERYSQLLTDYLKDNQTLFPKYFEYLNYGMKPLNKNYTNGIYMRDFSGNCDLKHPNDSDNYIC